MRKQRTDAKTERRMRIVMLYREGNSLQEIGNFFSLSRQRVHQILSQVKGFDDLREERSKLKLEILTAHKEALEEERDRRRRRRLLGDRLCNVCCKTKPEDQFYNREVFYGGKKRVYKHAQCKPCRNSIASRYPDRVRIANNKRRDYMLKGEEIQEGDLKALLRFQEGRCAYCENVMIKMELDHVIPLSRGGINALSNLAYACQPCNRKKNTKTAHEYRAILDSRTLTP